MAIGINLTRSQSHYIKAVYELSFNSENGGVRVIDIAERLSLSKASASIALTKLVKQGFLYKDADRCVHLTEKGEHKAIELLDKFDVIRTFLIKDLGVETSIADHDACAMEHVISTDTLCAICWFTKTMKCTDACSLSHANDP